MVFAYTFYASVFAQGQLEAAKILSKTDKQLSFAEQFLSSPPINHCVTNYLGRGHGRGIYY